MSTLKVASIQNLSGVQQYLCRAWANFNGTGTVAIRASGNVSSITDNGTGNYTVNFTSAMPDANYAFTANGIETSDITGRGLIVWQASNSYSTSTSCRIITGYVNTLTGGLVIDDADVICMAVFR